MAEYSFEEVMGGGAAATPKREYDFDEVMAGPGIVDYAKEVGKQIGVGVAEFGAQALRGIGQQVPLPGEMEMIASQGREEISTPPPKPPAVDLSTLPEYQLGERISKYVGSDQPSPILHPLATDLSRGLGSMIAGAPTMFMGGPILAARGEAAQRAVQAGATPEQQALAQNLGGGPGATELLDALLLTSGPGRAAGLLYRVGAKALHGALTQGGQEGLQQFIHNLISKGIYKPEQDLAEDVAYSALLGGILGGGIGGLTGIRKPPDDSGMKAGELAEWYKDVLGEEPPIGELPIDAPATPPPSGPIQRGPPSEAPAAPGEPSPFITRGGTHLNPQQAQNTLNYNRDFLARIEKTINDPEERRRDPEKIAHLETQVPGLRDTIERLTEYLDSVNKPARGSFNFGLITPAEAKPIATGSVTTPPRAPVESGPTVGDTGTGEDYIVTNAPNVSGKLGLPVRVIRGADGGMDVFIPEGGQPYRVPVDHRMGPTELILAMKYGPRGGLLDQRTVVRAPTTPEAPPPGSGPTAPAPVTVPPPTGPVTGGHLYGGLFTVDQVQAMLRGNREILKVARDEAHRQRILKTIERQEQFLKLKGYSIESVEPNTIPVRPENILTSQGEPLRSSKSIDTKPGAMIKPSTKKVGDISELMESREEVIGEEQPDLSQVGTFKGNPDINKGVVSRIMASNLYGDPADAATITVKEMFQNAFDAIKDVFFLGKKGPANIDIVIDEQNRTIRMTDDGIGMTRDIVANAFMHLGGSAKINKRPSGGLGIAKMMVLMESEQVHVRTMHKGLVTSTIFTGKQFQESLEDPTQKPDITVHAATDTDRRQFPKGHGTMVEVKIPESYIQENTGNVMPVTAPNPSVNAHPSLRFSPLLTAVDEGINVTLNGKTLPIGANFPIKDFTPFANINFDQWGSARVFISTEKQNVGMYNVRVLSNGVFQFVMSIKNHKNEAIPREIYVDVSPNVKPTQAGYPFAMNRLNFSERVKKDFERIFHAIREMYGRVDLITSAESFGNIEYLDFDETDRRVVNSGPQKLQLPPRKYKDLPQEIKPEGNNIVVEDGQLKVNGKLIPELSGKDLKDFRVDVEDLKIPQDQIPSDRVTYHDNGVTTPTGASLRSTSDRISITQYGVMKFGQRYYDYVYLMGRLFKVLRDVVADMPDPQTQQKYVKAQAFAPLKEWGIGISIDNEYRGVSILLPFRGVFLNPFLPVWTDSVKAASGMVFTMLHEFSHMTHRTETDLAPIIQELGSRLFAHPNFNFVQFLEKVEKVVFEYHDVMTGMRELFHAVPRAVEPAGRRFDVGVQQRTDAGLYIHYGGPPSLEPPPGSKLQDWVRASEADSAERAGPGDGNLTIAKAGDPSFGQRANQRALDTELGHSYVPAYQQTASTGPTRAAIGQVFSPKPTPPQIQAQAAHADRIDWLYKYAAGILELAQANPYFSPLINYVQSLKASHTLESQIQDRGMTIGKKWRGLGTGQSDAMMRMIDDVVHMTYLTPQERQQGIVRHPYRTDLDALIRKYGVGRRALGVYADVRNFFDVFLDLVTKSAIDTATRTISDPAALINAVNKINAATTNMKARPYFPFLRFGTHFITVKDQQGRTEFFSLYERTGPLPGQSAEANQQKALKRLRQQFPNSDIKHGVMPEDVRPLYGMPPQLLDHMKASMKLTPMQLDALEQLQFEMSPALSFKHRFQTKSYVDGYSRDFLRAFSYYVFHGARYHARTEYLWKLEAAIKQARSFSGNKETAIANYMDDHLQNTVLDVRGDYGVLKGLAFHWILGFMASSAFINLTQTPGITFPFLGNHFGDIKAAAAMSRAMAHINTFYKKGSYPDTVTDFELRALGYGMKVGKVSETQAAELAGLANGNGLLWGIGGNPVQRGHHWMMEKSALMFEGAEQFNRRIAYRAALWLAMKDPNNKFVMESVRRNREEYQNLVNGVNTGPSRRKFTPQEAAAIIAAGETVDQTQFVYHRYATPRILRGRKSAIILMFMRYVQATVMLMLNGDRGYRLRYLLMAVALGGLMGIPGTEEIKSIVQTILKRLGYNVNLDAELAEFLKHYTNEAISADFLLHGFSRRGFGVPAFLDMLGSFYTGRPGRGLMTPGPNQNVPMPILDFSKSMTPKLSPVDIGKLLEPYQDVNRTISEQTQRGAGAAVSAAFNVFKAIVNSKSDWDDTKRWEKAVPRVIGAQAKAFRTYAEERERASRGGPAGASTVLNYDVRDNEQLAEIIFQGLGFNTLRLSQEWDFRKARLEHIAYLKGQSEQLRAQFYEAMMSKDEREIRSVSEDIQKYNARLEGTEDVGYMITKETLKQSMNVRVRERVMQDAGLSRQKRDIPIFQELRELFPNMIDAQRR